MENIRDHFLCPHLCLIVINILLLPLLIGVNGIWLSVPVAEGMTLFLSIYFFWKKRLLSLYKIEKTM